MRDLLYTYPTPPPAQGSAATSAAKQFMRLSVHHIDLLIGAPAPAFVSGPFCRAMRTL